jgi:FKBP-type peptidyl-prolyl cis-trans isomerase FklB
MLALLHGVAFAEEVPEAKTENTKPEPVVEFLSDIDKVNYSLGYELGQDLKREELPAVPDILLKGVEDGLSGAKPAVKTSQRRAALADIKAKRAQENLERSEEFLAANAANEGVTTLPSGLQYKELTPGEGKTPTLNDRVKVHYRGTLIDGSEFDSSYKREQPSTFEVRKVIKGWREALQLMKEGAKWQLYVPPELAYGKAGRDKRIPPNSALIFEVELLSVLEPAQPAAPPPAPPGGKRLTHPDEERD